MTTGSSMADPCTICWVHILKSARHTKGLVMYKSIILPTNMLIFDPSNQKYFTSVQQSLCAVSLVTHTVLLSTYYDWQAIKQIPVFTFNFILENSINLNGGY